MYTNIKKYHQTEAQNADIGELWVVSLRHGANFVQNALDAHNNQDFEQRYLQVHEAQKILTALYNALDEPASQGLSFYTAFRQYIDTVHASLVRFLLFKETNMAERSVRSLRSTAAIIAKEAKKLKHTQGEENLVTKDHAFLEKTRLKQQVEQEHLYVSA